MRLAAGCASAQLFTPTASGKRVGMDHPPAPPPPTSSPGHELAGDVGKSPPPPPPPPPSAAAGPAPAELELSGTQRLEASRLQSRETRLDSVTGEPMVLTRLQYRDAYGREYDDILMGRFAALRLRKEARLEAERGLIEAFRRNSPSPNLRRRGSVTSVIDTGASKSKAKAKAAADDSRARKLRRHAVPSGRALRRRNTVSGSLGDPGAARRAARAAESTSRFVSLEKERLAAMSPRERKREEELIAAQTARLEKMVAVRHPAVEKMKHAALRARLRLRQRRRTAKMISMRRKVEQQGDSQRRLQIERNKKKVIRTQARLRAESTARREARARREVERLALEKEYREMPVLYSSRVAGNVFVHSRTEEIKLLLMMHGIAFRYVDVSLDHEGRRFMHRTSGKRELPQVFVDGVYKGGHAELEMANEEGMLFDYLSVENNDLFEGAKI